MKKAIVMSLLFLLVVSLFASGQKAAVEEERILIIGSTSEINSANRSEYNFDVLSASFSQLAPVYLDETGSYQPLLCDFSTEDSKTWKLTVREGFKWHDGRPVSAEDIAFSLYYMDEQEGGSGYAGRYEEINILDGNVLELVLPQANPRELANLIAFRAMPKHIYEGVEDYSTVPNESANIGNGPYIYTAFDTNSRTIEFKANEEYPLGTPVFDKIIIQLYGSSEAMYMALLNHEIDMVWKYSGGVETSMLEVLEKAGDITLQPVANSANNAVFIFNNNVAPFDNLLVRKAISKAIDYDMFEKNFASKFAKTSRTGFVPEGTYGYIETPKNSRDLSIAKNLLAEAGYADIDGDGFVEKDGKVLGFSIMVRGDKISHQRYAELIRNNLKEIGIDVSIDIKEVSQFRELTEKKKAHQAVVTGLTAFGMNKNQGMGALYLFGENPMGYGEVYSTEYEAILDYMDSAKSMEEYLEGAKRAQLWYSKNVPAIALFWDTHVQAYSDKLSDFSVDGNFGIVNVQSWLTVKVEA